MKGLGIPTLVLGGGGYTLRNVARCWYVGCCGLLIFLLAKLFGQNIYLSLLLLRTNETAILLGKQDEIPNEIPDNSEYFQFFAPDFTLRPPLAKKIENANTKEVQF